MPTNVLIVGAGAVGAFYASRIALAKDVCVSVICRSNYLAVKEKGFRVESPQYGFSHFHPSNVFRNPAEARECQKKTNLFWDYIVVSTKALPDVSNDSELLEGLVHQEDWQSRITSIVLIQNGLGVEEPYKRRFPRSPILSAVTIASAAQPEHGFIKHNRWTRISIGPYLPHLDAAKTNNSNTINTTHDEFAVEKNKAFVTLLQSGGIKDAEEYSHTSLQQVRWHKIAINASMNPSSVLAQGAPNEAMASDQEMSIHLKGVMDEVLSTAPKILGKEFPPSFASAERIINSTRKNKSGSKPSMALDWESRKPMELEVILGNPIRAARERGFEMPRMQSLYAMLKMAQERRDTATKEQNSSKL